MKQSRPKITSWQDAYNFLHLKESRKYANNTYIEIEHTDKVGWQPLVVKYHGHVIVRFYKNGTNEYSSCGYQTLTTKERLNWFLPDYFKVYQEKNIWYLAYVPKWDWNQKTVYEWRDGFKINKYDSVSSLWKIIDIGKKS